MEQTSKSNEMRPAVRLLIGIFATSMLFIGLPILVYHAIAGGSWDIWLYAFLVLAIGVGYAKIAVTGRWFCFRKPSGPKGA